MPKKGYYFEGFNRVKPPLGDINSVSDVKNYDWSSAKISTEHLEFLKKRAEWLYKNTDYALLFFSGYAYLGGCAMGFHEWGQGLRGWAKWLADLRVRKPLAEAILDQMMEILKYNVENIVSTLKDYVQVIAFGDDFGTEEGPQISVEIFREFYKHRFEELFSIVKRRSKMFIYFHSCGSIYPIIKELIDAGIDAINPVQISAKGMDPEKLKRDYGEQVTFWGGGADTQHVLPFAKPDEVVEHVKKLIKIFAPGGGFVFASVHNIQPPTPPENIVAMFETAYKYGKYPIRAS
ncbi:uroporphyrinogen decarboxylase family protein [Ignisphaera sp. 4213-co]|uniref:Uroporphyrinogen decarboxylase family protein n=1 Tax=Ignisphaera cupida TaxID=3050454 RepID=A0ABD4Z7Y3_9CREN|nr:uroporphyrinogen decarboxylase family protein [Ignisphaera sp. 4213-co]MDK6029354.1 uroporphyrinogen decarboxylase family protein [Ignisphaera sp. 4213-co]